MPHVTVGEENSGSIDLYYEDHGEGQPVVLIHGFPLNGASWEKQIPALLEAGHRVIHYDRRGFGKSSQPAVGYDYDTFAADLNVLMESLDLRDVVLAGFSMGTGEVTRYIANYGSERVSKAALFGAIPPFLLETDDNPKGLPRDLFEGFKDAIRQDRPDFFRAFLDDFLNVDVLMGSRISERAWQQQWTVAIGSSAIAAVECVETWLTDFRDDLPKIDVPTLLVHGTGDRILPIDVTARRLPGLIADLRFVEVEDGPHNIGWTHAEEVNAALVGFIATGEPTTVGKARAVVPA